MIFFPLEKQLKSVSWKLGRVLFVQRLLTDLVSSISKHKFLFKPYQCYFYSYSFHRILTDLNCGWFQAIKTWQLTPVVTSACWLQQAMYFIFLSTPASVPVAFFYFLDLVRRGPDLFLKALLIWVDFVSAGGNFYLRKNK